jgi:murein DD-endopeptidase MepM/ murein hydrolase activator NlpD
LLRIHRNKAIAVAIGVLLPLLAIAQNNNLHQPLSGKMLLSANYFELRDNHFHSGIDIKVGGVVGAKLFSINDGYVSRIQVRAGGYGKCLYIKHNDGTSSVYAHLHDYANPIDKFVKNIQYEKQQFEIDTLLVPEQISVSRGTLIGYAGDTGNSFGPHLHFEIRDTAQIPLNGIKFYPFADTKAPELNTLAIFSIDSIRTVVHSRTTHLIDLKGRSGNMKADSIIRIESPAYIGLECTDRMNYTHNKFGARKMKVELDNEVIFSTTIDNIPFSKTRYINSFIAYNEKVRNRKTLMKSYVEPGNTLEIYDVIKNSGLIALNDDKVHNLTISVTDDYNNTSTLSLRAQEKKTKGNLIEDNGGKFFRWNKDNFHISNELVVHIPKEALYNNILFDIEKIEDSTASFCSPMFRLHTSETPLHKPMRLALKANVPDSSQSKALIAYHSSLLSSKRGCIGGEYSNGYVNASSASFGYFYVTVDTIPPIITPNFKDKADLRGRKEISIKIWDDLSGIKSYNGYIDDTWVLFEYNAKKDMLTHTFDKSLTTQGKKHKLTLEVSDRKNNVTTLTTEFTW